MKLASKLIVNLSLSMTCLSAAAIAATGSTAATSTPTVPATTATIAPATAAPATATAIKKPASKASSAATSTVAAPKKEEAPTVKFGLGYDLGYSMQAKAQPDGSRSQSLSHEFVPSMSYGEYNAFAYMGYNQDLVATNENGWSDLILGAGKKAWTLSEYLKLGPSITLVQPLTNRSRNEIGLLYAFSAALKLTLNTKTLGMDAFKLSYQGQISRANLQYDTNAKTGAPNRLHGYRSRINIGYDITDALSFSTQFDFNSNYSVNGIVSNTFSHSQTLGYTLNDHASLSFTHSNEGPYLKTGTYENNLKFFNDEDSSYSIGLGLSI